MVTDVLSHLGVPVVFVFCPVLLSTKKLYEVVLTALEARIKGNPASSTAHGAGDSSDDDDHATVRVNHDRFSEFVARVKALWRSPETLYLVRKLTCVELGSPPAVSRPASLLCGGHRRCLIPPIVLVHCTLVWCATW
jgi:hypothetical protein